MQTGQRCCIYVEKGIEFMNGYPVQPQITEYLYQKAARAGIALSGTFELTPLCNMSCKMCYVTLAKKEQESIACLRGAKEWLDLAKKAKENGMVYLLLTGGEPFLHPEFREIMEGLHSMGFILSINSNGTLIDEETVEWLKKCPPSRINISIYGKNDETYAELCNNPKGFTQMSNAVSLLKKAGITVKLNCSVTPHNAKELPEMIEFAKKNECAIQVATYMFPPVRKNANMVGENYRLSPEEASYYEILADYLTYGKEKLLSYENGIPQYKENDDDCIGVRDSVRCRAGKCSFWVTWKGDMLPCGMFDDEESLNVFEADFSSAWEKTKERISKITLPSKCAKCNIKDKCRACAAMVITESGNFEKEPQYRCDMMKSYPRQYQKVKGSVL